MLPVGLGRLKTVGSIVVISVREMAKAKRPADDADAAPRWDILCAKLHL